MVVGKVVSVFDFSRSQLSYLEDTIASLMRFEIRGEDQKEFVETISI